MKISILCNSPLLQNSLKIFLKEFLSSYKQCDLVISDYKIEVDKPVIVVNSSSNADIQVPFSKSELIYKIEQIYKKIYKNDIEESKILDQKREDFSKLESEIDKVLLEFKDKLIKVVKDFYE